MMELHPSFFYLMIEGLAVLTLLLIILLFLPYRKYNRKKRTLVKLVDNLTRATHARREDLIEHLGQSQTSATPEAITDAANKILRHETLFCQYIVNLMLSKDAMPLLDLDHQIENLTKGVIEAHRASSLHTAQPTERAESLLSPAITAEMAQIRNDLTKLYEQNDRLLSTINDLALNTAAPQRAAKAQSIVADALPNDEIVHGIADDASKVIDISADIESLDDFNEHGHVTPINNDATDIDALLAEVRNENLSNEIEEIPDHLLDQEEEVSMNSAITDIDALLEQVAKENIEKSVSSG